MVNYRVKTQPRDILILIRATANSVRLTKWCLRISDGFTKFSNPLQDYKIVYSSNLLINLFRKFLQDWKPGE